MTYLDTTLILVRKNFFLSFRDSAALAITLLSAFFSMLVLYFSQISIDNGDGFAPEFFDNPNPSPVTISTIPRCVPLATEECYTIAYVPKSDPRVSAWVTQTANISSIPETEIIGFQDDIQLNQFFVENPNRTQAAYIFDPDSLAHIQDNNVSFIVQYNETEQFEFPIGTTDFHSLVVLPAMIHQMNLVIMSELSNKTLDISLNASVFPHPNLIDVTSGSGLDAFGQYGDILTFATFFLALVFFLYRIVQEKERGLRDSMRLAGQVQSQHFISWIIPFFVVNLILIFLVIGFGRAFGFKIFIKNSFPVYFLTMFIFTNALIAWTMLIATITSKSTAVSVVAFNLFIFGYLLGSIGGVVYATDEEGESIIGESTYFLRELFAIFPSTMYVKAINNINTAALIGQGYTMSTIAKFPFIFSVRKCWFWMLGSTAVAAILSIYLDNVLPTEHGIPLSPFYPFQVTYWFPNRSIRASSANDEASGSTGSTPTDDLRAPDPSVQYNPNEEDADVRAEREAVAAGQRDDCALVIKNISKRFKSTLAVDDVSFSVKRNTAFALLGHNGAGKSTLFKMLVTSLRSSGGDAYIYGHSVRKNQVAVRKLLGVCPQFDMYWDRLTGAEHIQVFSALKGMPRSEWSEEVERRLMDVDLLDKANVYAASYSGGMQRRLSVAMSLTGDPKIVLLDECTSGADPLVRRDLWASIQRAKEGRVVFMITHSIAEAQHIAGHNQIGIMAKGKLRVLGNALHLKSKFGAGYGIIAVLNNEETARSIEQELSAVCSGATLKSTSVGENGEVLARYSLPRASNDGQVLAVVEFLENGRETHGIRDYSINSTSLGEVFTSITSLSEDVVEEAAEEDLRIHSGTTT